MVDWNSKERGVRIGDYDAIRGIYLGCTPCNRWVGMEIDDAIAAFGAHAYTRDLAQRLKCKECGKREGYVMVWAKS